MSLDSHFWKEDTFLLMLLTSTQAPCDGAPQLWKEVIHHSAVRGRLLTLVPAPRTPWPPPNPHLEPS